MSELIIFIFKGNEISIQCNRNENMNDIFKRVNVKLQQQIDNLYFLYNGQVINKSSKLENIIGSNKVNKIIIQELNNQNLINDNIIKKSKYVICPDCGENCLININDYKIYLSQCDKGHSSTLLLDEFINNQKIDESMIICNKCKNNKNQIYKNQFYKCGNCNINLCPICKDNHNSDHIIIDYDSKNYLCNKHGERYISYCNECKINLCDLCELEHNKNHTFIYHREIISDNSNQKYEELKIKINNFKSKMYSIINLSEILLKNIEKYRVLIDEIINNKDKKTKNYQILRNLQNLNNFNENLIKDIDILINEENIHKLTNNMIKLIEKMTSEIMIQYKNESGKIEIFGDLFVKNNKDNCSMIINGKLYDISTHFNFNEKNSYPLLELLAFKPLKNMSCMFNKCPSLLSVLNLSKIVNKNVTNMSNMFYGCSSLISLPDISKWDISNVTDISYMFYSCKSLLSLPDISNWNTFNIKSLSGLFSGCLSLSSLSDISKWNISNVYLMNFMFSHCKSLKTIPDLSKWNFSNVENVEYMFYNCSSLSSLPDISKWNLQKNAKKENILLIEKKNDNEKENEDKTNKSFKGIPDNKNDCSDSFNRMNTEKNNKKLKDKDCLII